MAKRAVCVYVILSASTWISVVYLLRTSRWLWEYSYVNAGTLCHTCDFVFLEISLLATLVNLNYFSEDFSQSCLLILSIVHHHFIGSLLGEIIKRGDNWDIIFERQVALLGLAWLGVCCLPSAVEGRLANDASTFINRAVLHSVCHTALRSRFLPCPVICLCSSWCSTAMILVSHFSLVAYPCYPGLHLLPHYQIESADDSSW